MIWKLLIFAICGYVLFRLFSNDRKKNQEEQKNTEKEKVADGTLVRDPICGTYVDKDSSISVRDGEHVKYFCGSDCRDTYIKRIEEQEKLY